MIATPQLALEAAAAVARAAGVTPLILGDAHRRRGARGRQGAWPASRCQVARARPARSRRRACCCPAARPRSRCAATGRGGRNVEFLLALAVALDGEPGVSAPSPATPTASTALEEIAGALLAPDTLARAWAQGIDRAKRARRQRRPRLLRGARRLGRHRPDADQRQRLPRHPDRRQRRRRQAARLTMRRHRNAKIVATLGPASAEPRDHPRAVRGRRRRVPAQLQPRHARGPQRSAST